MFIKRLELQGFKTFPERTRIVFNPGITIIIGPNGTGKSNIVEAIQWVLGGQRVRTVRGEKTEDAIFNGTLKRPAVGMADVTLVLQNSEEEMQINHRVFRTGEGEYRLNGKPVRLRDIQEELWKKAISENKYYVIEQGSIGTFVTSKPTEKRTLIEEAAGTAYYRDKKRLAEHKLEETEQNLTRLEDIIAEVAKARNSLARQAGAAERYRKLRERVRELTVLHFDRKAADLAAAQVEIQGGYDQALAGERESLARLNEAEKALNQSRKEAWDLEQGLKEGRDRLYSLQAQIARAEAERERETRRVADLDIRRRRAAGDSDALLADLLAVENEIGRIAEDFRALEDQRAGRIREVEDKDRVHGEVESLLAPLAKKVESARGAAIQKLADLTAVRNERGRYEKELEIIRRQEEKLQSRREEALSELEAKENERADLETDLTRTSSRIDGYEASASEGRRLLEKNLADIEDIRARAAALKEKRDEASYHLQALRRLEAQEREADGTSQPAGAIGSFTELISSNIEDAPLIDVVWKEEARALLIEPEALLGQLGLKDLKGSFLLLPTAPMPEAENGIEDSAVIGRLRARLRAGDKLSGRWPALPDAWIVADLKAAVRLWMENPGRCFVTPMGDVLFGDGLLKVGLRKEGLFTFAQEIRDLEAVVADKDAALEPLADALKEGMEEKARLEKLVAEAEENLGILRAESTESEKRLALAMAEAKKLTNDLAVFEYDLEVLAADGREFLGKLEVQASELEVQESEERELRDRAEVEEREYILHQEKARAEARALAELRGALDVLTEKVAHLKEGSEALAARRTAAQAKIETLQAEKLEAEGEQEAARRLAAELSHRAVQLGGQRTEAEAALAGSEKRLEELRGGVAEAETRIQAMREDHERRKDERMSREVHKAEIDRDLVNLEESCWQELKKTLQEVRAEARSAPAPAEKEKDEGDAAAGSPADVEAALEEAKDKIQKIGAVNLMAEEEYKAQKERHDFLVQQRTDLRDSITQTKDAIRQIDDESRQRFLTALAEVNKFFKELFVTLFKGGTAEVRLLDENDILESGVEVIAQPPGKKVQNMGLLSGGEKSLTSLAFLFALFHYKPTPFCILDEVDAALDETNLVRFLDLMKAIKSDTQFIIITHNYRTMEVADYIYGTTMEEPNVTKVFSMKLEKKPDEEKGA